jgi:hypothetical protein
MKTKYLSKEERDKGTQYYLKWATFNGFGFSFLGDTPVYLMAIYFGATNVQLGYLSAIIQISGLILLFLPRLLAGTNIITVQFVAWLLRGLVCFLYTSVLFFTGQQAVSIILSVYTLFCLIRAIGTAMSSPIQQMLTTSSTTGEIVVKMSNNFQKTRFISQFISFSVFSVKQLTGISGYLLLMGLGIITNTISSLYLRKVPCREVVEYRQGRSIFAIFAESMKDKERAMTLFVKWHTLSLSIIFAFIIPFLRKIAFVPPNLIFLYTIVGTFATISAGYLIRPFADRIGSRPILTVASFLLAGVALLWSIIPPTIYWAAFFPLGFLTTFLMGIVGLLASRLELRSIPEKDKISYVSMMNFSSAFVSLIVGIFGGKLADFGEQVGFPGLNPFGLTFFIAVILAMQNGIFSVSLRDSGSLSVRETANILFSTQNLKAFLDIYQLNITADPIKRTTILMSIGKSDTPIAAGEIRRILKNPLSVEKGEVLRSLLVYPKPSLLKDIIREASDVDSYYRSEAIFALGTYPSKAVEDLLISFLDDPSSDIRSTAAKSLARIGNTTTLQKIRQLAQDPALTAWAVMNYVLAISIMDQEGEYLAELFTMANHRNSASFEQAIFSLVAKVLEFEPVLADLYQEENVRKHAGFRQLLEEAKQLRPFFDHVAMLSEYYDQGKYQDIWRWCRELLAMRNIEGAFSYLKQAIETYDLQAVSKDNTFAVMYFTYQMLKSGSQ